MVSTDAHMMNSGSEARVRMERYAAALGELHIVVIAPRSRAVRHAQGHTGNLFLYAACGNVFPRFVRAYRILALCARRQQFDVITAQAPDEVGMIAWLIARKFGIALQLQVHTDIMSPWYRRASWKEAIRYQLATLLIPRADCIRVVSLRIKQSLISRFGIDGSRITVLPIFSDASEFSGAAEDPHTSRRFESFSFKMIAAGRFVDKEKNFSMLIEMMRKFAVVCPDALLVLVGDGPDKKKYEGKIKDYGLEKNVMIEPWRRDLPSFYKSFDVFLLSSNYEGWGRAAVEAMAAGLPVVMTDVGLAGEVVRDGENGIVVPIGNQSAFFGACKNVYHDPALRSRLAVAARSTVAGMRPQTRNEYEEEYKMSFMRCTK